MTKLKAFKDVIINATQKLKFGRGRIENILGKGENAGYQHFFPFPKMVSKASFLRVVKKLGLCGRVNLGHVLTKGCLFHFRNAFCIIIHHRILDPQSHFRQEVLCGSVVKCLTCNPEALGLSHTRSSGFFCGSILGQDTSEPQPSTGETQERHE